MSDSHGLINPTAGSLLGFLVGGGPMTGWDLYRSVEGSTGHFWNVTRSQVYRELRDLERRGLITAGESGPRGRIPYRASDAGERAFAEWLSAGPGPDLIRHHLLLTVFFANQLDRGRLLELLRESRRHHERTLDTFRHLYDDTDDSLPGATLRFGVRYEEMVLAWIDEVMTSLARGASS